MQNPQEFPSATTRRKDSVPSFDTAVTAGGTGGGVMTAGGAWRPCKSAHPANTTSLAFFSTGSMVSLEVDAIPPPTTNNHNQNLLQPAHPPRCHPNLWPGSRGSWGTFTPGTASEIGPSHISFLSFSRWFFKGERVSFQPSNQGWNCYRNYSKHSVHSIQSLASGCSWSSIVGWKPRYGKTPTILGITTWALGNHLTIE